MSFDLVFVCRSSPPSWEAVAEWASAQPHMSAREDESARQVWYENPHTGVYASFWYGDSGDEAPGDGFCWAGLAFNLNYCRSGFFAVEAMPLVEAVAEHFDLQVCDPQGANVPEPVDVDGLIERWEVGNRSGIAAVAAVSAFSGDARVTPQMPRDHAMAFWQYCSLKPQIDEEMGDEFFVPRLNVMRLGDRAIRVAFLTRPTMYVLPPCDALILKREHETILIKRETLVEALGRYLDDDDEFPVRIFSEPTIFDTDIMDVWDAFYDRAAPEFDLSQMSGIGADGFVDEQSAS